MSIPGYVDLQVNGYMGIDFSSVELTEYEFLKASYELLNNGTCIFLPTIITSPMDVYRKNIPVIANAVRKNRLEAHIPGIHLEGPFISKIPGAIGCHRVEYVLDAKEKHLEEFINLSEGFIKLLTVAADAPEITTIIKAAKNRNIAVSLGHHLAGYGQIKQAVEAGAVALTHIGNGIPNMLPRHGNPILNGLANDELIAMIITDGHHLPEEFIKCVIKIKRAENTIVVSDMSPLSGMPPGEYDILGGHAVLEANGRLHNPEKNCLSGSASTMKQCMKFLESMNFLSSNELELISYYNPLKLIGLK